MKQYEIRNVLKSDLDAIRSLSYNKEFFDTEDFWLYQSKICEDEDGNILGFALLKPHSLIDFFGGEIPDDMFNPIHKESIKEDINKFFEDKQYEVLFYIKDDVIETNIQLDLIHKIEIDKEEIPIGVL